MARNPEIQVVDTDPQRIIDSLTALFEQYTGTRVYPASPTKLFILSIAYTLIQERVLTNWAINQCIPSRADGTNLDGLAELTFQRERRKATAARCTMKFTISEAQASAVLIPGGTRITDENRTVYWATEEDWYILPGETEIDIQVVCQTAGAVGNGWKPGTISYLVDVFDYYTSCRNTTESDGGSDAMSDAELYEAMRLSMDALSTAGPEGAYTYFAKTVSSEIADVSACTSAPGTVTIFAIGKDGRPVSEELKQKILETCSADDRRPMTDLVKMAEPVDVTYNVDLTYYLPRATVRNSSAIEAAVTKAVAEFNTWQCGRLGRDINPSELIRRIMATGVKRVEVRSPAFQVLEDGKSFDSETDEQFKAPELAKTGTVKVVNGGMEDE